MTIIPPRRPPQNPTRANGDAVAQTEGADDATIPRSGRQRSAGASARQRMTPPHEAPSTDTQTDAASLAQTVPRHRANAPRVRQSGRITAVALQSGETPGGTTSASAPPTSIRRPVTVLAAAATTPASAAAPTTTAAAAGWMRYQLGEELGRGGIGVVHTALDPTLRRDIAIKSLLRADDANEVASFIEEAQITGQLEHPNIVPIHELGTDPHGRPFLVMKRIEGRTLRELMEESETKRRMWPDEESALLGIFIKLCDAMAYAHARGVIHRDLKPDNVMVGEFGEVLVMDWGLAKPLASGADQNPHAPVLTDRRNQPGAGAAALTMQGEVFGTPSYMPPEQARGNQNKMSERADIFALGAVLYALLALRPPYTGKNAVQVLALAFKGQFTPAERAAPWRKIPRELAAIAAKAMAYSPADRYASVRELISDLVAYQRFAPILARRDSPLVAMVKWMRRHPRLALGSALSVVFSLIVGVLGVQLRAAQTHAELADANRAAAEQLAIAEQARADHQAALAAAEAARRSDAEAVAQERQALLQRMRARDYDYVLGLLEAQVHSTRDAATEEFLRLFFAARSEGKTDEQLIAELGATKVDEYIAAFDQLFDQHDRRGIAVTAQDYFFRGLLRAMGKNDNDGAIADHDRALQLDPNHVGALNNRGMARFNKNDLDAAMADFDRAVELNPNNAEILRNRGVARRYNKDFDGAIADFDRTLQLNPNYAEAFNNRGVAWHAKGDLERAIADFDRALQLNPNHPIALNNRGEAWRDKGDLERALADFDQALELNPNHVGALNNRGGVRSDKGDFDGAIADYDKVLQLDPNDVKALNNRGIARRGKGDWNGAIADYDHALEIDPNYADAYNNRGVARHVKRDFDAAINDFNHAIQLNPNIAAPYVGRGNAHGAKGNWGRAMADYEQAIQLDPTIAQAYNGRGMARRATGNLDGALADLDQAVKLNPNDVVSRYNRGDLRHAKGDLDGAMADFDRTIELAPNHAAALNSRGDTRRIRGDLDGAMADLNQAIEFNPNYPPAYVSRAIVRDIQGDTDGAIADLDHALQLNPRLWPAWANRASVIAATDPQAALHALQQAYRFCPNPAVKRQLANRIRRAGGTVPD